MKKNLFSTIFTLAAIFGFFAACSSSINTASVEIPVGQIFRSAEQNGLLNKNEATESESFELKIFLTLNGSLYKEETIPYDSSKDSATYTFDDIPIGSELEISAELYKGQTKFYEGKSEKITIKENENLVSLSISRIKSDTQTELKSMPSNIRLETSFSNDDTTNTVSLATETATFHIYYLDDEYNKKTLPEWVTYSWKLNGNSFETDETNAKFEKSTGTLTIYLNKNPYILKETQSDSGTGTQNTLAVELGSSDSSELTSASVEFFVTE